MPVDYSKWDHIEVRIISLAKSAFLETPIQSSYMSRAKGSTKRRSGSGAVCTQRGSIWAADKRGKEKSLFFYILLINFALDKPLQQISDDEDDTHPNVDTPSLFKWRHEARYADLHFYFFFQPGTHFFSPLSNLSTSHSFGFLSPIFCKHLGVRSATIQKWAVARSRQGLVWFGPCEQQHFAICAVVAPLSNSSPFLKPTFFFPPFYIKKVLLTALRSIAYYFRIQKEDEKKSEKVKKGAEEKL